MQQRSARPTAAAAVDQSRSDQTTTVTAALDRAAEVRRAMHHAALVVARDVQQTRIAHLMVDRQLLMELEERVRHRIERLQRDARWVMTSRFISGVEDVHCRTTRTVRLDVRTQQPPSSSAKKAAVVSGPSQQRCSVAKPLQGEACRVA